MITPQRRQEIALGGMIGGALIGTVAVLIGFKWWRRRRRAE
jgi:hypothetical protein